jgi:ATP-binding cassette subfamily F protein uup
VTSVVAWEGDAQYGGKPGLWREYEGGITDWLTQRERSRVQPALASSAAAPAAASAAAPAARSKLSYKEQRELDGLPAQIEALEAEQRALVTKAADPKLYTSDAPRAAELHGRLAAIDVELSTAIERWETLASR